jgi:transposase-like protein
VPSHNNGAEQAVRQLKRKTKQAEQFGNTKRAKESLAGLSVVQTARKRKERVVKKVQDIFKR